MLWELPITSIAIARMHTPTSGQLSCMPITFRAVCMVGFWLLAAVALVA